MKHMRQFTALLFTVVAMFAPSLNGHAGYVKGYYRKDGTYVAPHYRSNPSTQPKVPASTFSVPKVPSHASSGFKAPKSYQVYQQRQAQGPRAFSKDMKIWKYNEQGGICPHCHKHFDYNQMEGDHVVPYSKGGTTTYSNLQMLCMPCNRSKGNRSSR